MLRKGFIGFSNVRRSTYGSSSRYSQFIRYNSTTSWLNPLSKFKKKEVPKTVNIPSIIIEEPEPNTYSTNSNNTNQHAPSNKALIRDLKHYLKSDVPDIIRVKVLTDKLSQYIHNVPDFALDKQAIPLINKVFMKLQQLGGAQEVLPLPDLLVLFEKSAIAITNTSSLLASLYVPEYVAFLARHFLTDFGGEVPMKIYVYVVELGSSIVKGSTLGNTLQLLFNNAELRFTPEFTVALVKYLEFRGKLNLNSFQEILNSVIDNGRVELIDNEFVDAYASYVEKLYLEEQPKVHEYKDLERNVDNVQQITDRIISGLIDISANLDVGSWLKLLKLSYELNSVNLVSTLIHSDILLHLSQLETNRQLFFENVRREVFKQDLGNETLAETLLIVCCKDKQLKEIALMLGEYIDSDDIKFSFDLRLQAKISRLLSTQVSESELFDQVKEVITKRISEYGEEVPLSIPLIHSKCIQICLTSSLVQARGYFTQSMTNLFQKEFFMSEPPVYSFKYQIDKSIERNNHVQAVNSFEDSLDNFTQWPSDTDPMVRLTLNNLIVLLCNNMDNVEDIFPIFTKIKQQMTNTECNIYAINSMTTKMLQSDFVGDTIEFLKRELPKIGKEDTKKLPLSIPAYNQLFLNLQAFVLSYKGESTFETNWVLYGEVHRYFHVPYEFYLPAMKFFAENDRLNASLIIFRHMLRLSELHGDHYHLPPGREHYMFLFLEFGDKLYEEGVEEIHERLKMNLTIPKQDIELQNCMLNAYLNLQDISRTKDLFLSMLSTPKQIGGINEESIQIMIKTYTYSDIIYVKKFWNNLSQYGIIPNYPIMKQYLIAHVYHGQVEEAIQLVNTEMKDYEIEMSTDLLISMFNFTLDGPKQKKIEEWAKIAYPTEWEEVKSSGLLNAAGEYKPDTQLLVDSPKPKTE